MTAIMELNIHDNYYNFSDNNNNNSTNDDNNNNTIYEPLFMRVIMSISSFVRFTMSNCFSASLSGGIGLGRQRKAHIRSAGNAINPTPANTEKHHHPNYHRIANQHICIFAFNYRYTSAKNYQL